MDRETEMTWDRMERGLEIGLEQELQEGCSRIDRSTHFSIYKRIKEGIGRERERESYLIGVPNGNESEREKFGPEQDVEIYIISEDTKRNKRKE